MGVDRLRPDTRVPHTLLKYGNYARVENLPKAANFTDEPSWFKPGDHMLQYVIEDWSIAPSPNQTKYPVF